MADTKSWHAIPSNDLLRFLKADEEGLAQGEADKRLKEYGPNELPHEPPTPWWIILLREFKNPLIYILAIAAIVSVMIGKTTNAVFIVFVLAINALIGTYQEYRAEKSSRALQKLLKIRASVMREGEMRELDAEEVVPGDIVWLESGNRVPADMRLLSTHGLSVDESLLSGESLAVLKDADWFTENEMPLADRHNMVHAGSMVVSGRAKAVVVATAMKTAVGQLALDVLGTKAGKPPLVLRMEKFSQTVAIATLAVVFMVALLGIAIHGYGTMQMFMFGVALAVSVIPEGLPVAMSVALAIGSTRMARRGVIVRQLTAVEGLGSCTLIASDKTGTLTCNELTVREIRTLDGQVYQVTGEGFEPHGEIVPNEKNNPNLEALALASVLCNEADLRQGKESWVWRGDPTDVALLTMAHKIGDIRERIVDQHPQVNDIPFESERQFAASFNRVDGKVRAYVKGAPERVFEMCDVHDESNRLHEWQQRAESMAEQGYRVLALAEGEAPSDLEPSEAPPDPKHLSLLGLVGMIDPLRPGVQEAVKKCHGAGVEVWMVTGDHPVTALAISKDLGLANQPEQVITGAELEKQSENEMFVTVKRARVYARVTPRQKLQLVEAARKAGHFVAVTGDGVNDAPALRASNIGVAMGKGGTDVARDAAKLVISDDNFATIVSGIEEGRVAYGNVRKVINLLISTGAAEVVLIMLAIAFGMPLPLLPTQLLWLNLVTNGTQDVALAFEPSEGDVLKQKPRAPNEPIFNRLMIERTVVAAIVMGCVAFGVFAWLINSGWSDVAARNIILLLMVLFENVHIGDCRSETKFALFLSPLRSPLLVLGAMTALFIHIAFMYLPLGHTILKAGPVHPKMWGILIVCALSVFVALEIHKWTWHRRYSRHLQK